ncbi:hypothetical protein FGO68_gene2546 [Halteria grandinella]|uniref:Uncharacterized protein n=1 Tax=Halteria grandinella TaxID=5974 RepID=A0A8J8SXA5_HALGN|nr:hypothetical protein FGO68_gene2546 [Halteria grandinella]
MLSKLETKLKREVQQRIESQRKLQIHVQETGMDLQDHLLSTFDQECQALQDQVTQLEQMLTEQWEPNLLKDLTDNRATVNSFDKECQDAFTTMRLSLQAQFKKTERYEQQVLERSEELDAKVFEDVLVAVEKERDLMEKEMTQKIVEFNFRVKQEAGMLDETVKNELNALREEIERERGERIGSDQAMLQNVTEFLISLQ